MAFRWRDDDSQTLKDGSVALDFQEVKTTIPKDTYSFAIFQWVRGKDPIPPLDPRMVSFYFVLLVISHINCTVARCLINVVYLTACALITSC